MGRCGWVGGQEFSTVLQVFVSVCSQISIRYETQSQEIVCVLKTYVEPMNSARNTPWPGPH